jgi:8-oxo-dGTP diphosphatase
MAPRLRVAALVIRDARVLLVEHEKDGRRYWLLPGGGVETGERLTAALVREGQEELGVTLEPGELAFVGDTIAPGGARHIVHLIFFASCLGEPHHTAGDPRVRSVGWLSAEELADVEVHPDIKEWLLSVLTHGPRPARYQPTVWKD